MRKKATYIFRTLSLVGLILAFFSVFLEWYSFQVYDFNNHIIASWSYYLFSEWQTPFSTTSAFNEAMKPSTAITIPLILNIVFIAAIIASGYVLLVKNIDQAENLRKYTKFAYLNIFVMLLVAYYIIICPLLYLAPSKLYFPLLSIRNYEEQGIYCYSIGLGYLVQLFSFLLIFPYTVFYYKTILTFIHEEQSHEKLLQATIINSQEPVHLDRYIAEEELKRGERTETTQDEQEKAINPILTTFIEGKK